MATNNYANLYSLMSRLFPICRSITGDGNRKTAEILSSYTPLEIFETRSGSEIYDWVVPNEWNIKDAFISDAMGLERIVDFRENNLHVVGYSSHIDRRVGWKELSEHLYTHPKLATAVPYRTGYYAEQWGFCVTHSQYKRIRRAASEGALHVFIDSSSDPQGSMTWGHAVVPGDSKKEVWISTYLCHPSMANDNLSGVVVAIDLLKKLRQKDRLAFTYRFFFVPETIGALLALNQFHDQVTNVLGAMVLTTCAGRGPYGLKYSYNKDHFLNSLAENNLTKTGIDFFRYDYDHHGSDERQYSSPGSRINCISVVKDKYYEYPEYHSSADDLSFVSPKALETTRDIYLQIIDDIEQQTFFERAQPHGELMLSKYGLYPEVGGSFSSFDTEVFLNGVLGYLFYCDGVTPSASIASKLNLSQEYFESIENTLFDKSLIKRV